jgi:hypothetical protein
VIPVRLSSGFAPCEIAVTTAVKRPRQRAVSPTVVIPAGSSLPVYRISVAMYHEMIRAGILGEDDPIELLEGLLVPKMPKYPPHVTANNLLVAAFAKLLPDGFVLRVQDPITLKRSEPEPDIVVACGRPRDFSTTHPGPKQVALLVEVAESSLAYDRGVKKRIYAAAGIDIYWVVNLPESTIEVFTEPFGGTKAADYRTHQTFTARQKLPVVLNGKKIGTLAVADVLP